MDSDLDITPVLTRVHTATGVDFSGYREATLRRRIGRRMDATHCADVAAYESLLDADTEELHRLLSHLTIKYSEFFRDDEVFSLLENDIFPQLLSTCRSEARPLQVWSAACATGEEVYSVAALLSKLHGFSYSRDEVRILATDIDPAAVRTAQGGRYTVDLLPRVPDGYPDCCFVRYGVHLQIAAELQDSITFAIHNLIEPEAQSKLKDLCPRSFDIIFCRNVLVYLNKAAQAQVLELCAGALRPGGFLVLGTRETVPGKLWAKLKIYNTAARIYRRVDSSGDA